MSDEERKPYTCPQCGIEFDMDVIHKRRARGDMDTLCRDCRDTAPGWRLKLAITHPILGRIECRPYRGDLDENWNPIDEHGNLFMPGERICGHKDCVAKKHILQVQTLPSGKNELERVQAE